MTYLRFDAPSLKELIAGGDKSIVCQINTEKPKSYYAPKSLASCEDYECPSKDLHENFLSPRLALAPGRSVTLLRDVLVMPNSAIVTSDGNIIRESCFPYTGKWIADFFRPWLVISEGVLRAEFDRFESVDKPAVYVREHGEDGFFHWMHSVYPRIEVFSEHSLSGDYTLLCKCDAGFQRDALSLIDMKHTERVNPNLSCPQFFRELIFPSPLVDEGDFWRRPLSVGQFYDNLILPVIAPKSRLYISRKEAGVRRISNEEELIASMTLRGFEVIELGSLSFIDQLALFRSCEMVVAPHGAGLAHIIGMKPGARVLEILHPLRFWATYRAMAARRGIRYGIVVGETRSDENSDASDFSVDVDRVLAVVAELGLP